MVELLRETEQGAIPEEQATTKKRTRRTHSARFKARIALLALRGDLTVAEIAERNQIHPNQVTQWKTQLVEQAAAAFDAGPIRRVSTTRGRCAPRWNFGSGDKCMG